MPVLCVFHVSWSDLPPISCMIQTKLVHAQVRRIYDTLKNKQSAGWLFFSPPK